MSYILFHFILGLAMLLIVGRVIFYSTWSEFGMGAVYAFIIPWQLAFLMGESEQDMTHGLKFAGILIAVILFLISIHSTFGDSIQGMMGIEVAKETASLISGAFTS